MKRRDFLKSTAAVTGGVFSGLHTARAQISDHPVPGDKPNILFIMVDELRYPTVFPDDIKTPEKFLERYMPHVHHLWQRGVKFGEYHCAANACGPSRGVMITGLYSQQNWSVTTILSTPPQDGGNPDQKQPVLNHNYPTYGKLLQANGYQTPYIGKWHVSVPSSATNTLQNYGFDYYPTYYDPTGDNLQGTYGDEKHGFHSDAYSADQAIDWLTGKQPFQEPWCLTVSLVNPHDREFFPAGTEFKTVNDLFADSNLTPAIGPYGVPPEDGGTGCVVPWEDNQLKSPRSYGYPQLPPNWEGPDSLKSKPTTQTFIQEFQQAIWGGVTNDPSQDTAAIEPYPNRPGEDLGFGVAKMPFSYWQRGMDSYTQIMQVVDGQIGRVLKAFHSLPPKVVENTVIVFVSDHGEYNGAHGMLQGKMMTVYEEAWHIPLIVVDPSGRFTDDIGQIRNGLTSSVDLLNMLVSIGYKGTTEWMTGNLATIYGKRHDMLAMLKSPAAPGRSHVLFATDEVVPAKVVFNKAPTHVLGLRMEDTKLGVYSKWLPLSATIIPSSVEKEFYDYSSERGLLELDSMPWDGRVQLMYEKLIHDLIPTELQAPLPGALGVVQKASKLAHLAFRELIAIQPSGKWKNHGLRTLLGYGHEF